MESCSAPEMDPLLEALRARFRPFPLIQNWGVEILKVAPGKAWMHLAANPFTTNPDEGRINGGVLATLADMACALALCTHFEGRMPFSTADLHIRYLESASGDVEAEAEVIRLSRRSAVLECRLTVGARRVAQVTCAFALSGERG